MMSNLKRWLVVTSFIPPNVKTVSIHIKMWKYLFQLNFESTDHGDLVQGSFTDSYRNLTYKNVMGLLWVTQFCSHAQYIVKTDDDMFLDMFEIWFLIYQYSQSEVRWANFKWVLKSPTSGLHWTKIYNVSSFWKNENWE